MITIYNCKKIQNYDLKSNTLNSAHSHLDTFMDKKHSQKKKNIPVCGTLILSNPYISNTKDIPNYDTNINIQKPTFNKSSLYYQIYKIN